METDKNSTPEEERPALADPPEQDQKPPTSTVEPDEKIGLDFPVKNGVLQIPPGVLEIEEKQFAGRKDITAVEFLEPVLLESIGRAAFCDCVNLRKVRFPMKMALKEIGEDAFRRCGALETLDVPSGVERLGDNAFSECTRLTGLKLPPTLKQIGTGAFSLCFRLRHVVIPQNVTAIGAEAFYLSRSTSKYITLDFGEREDFTGIDRGVLRESRHCPNCGRPYWLLHFRRCPCGAELI